MHVFLRSWASICSEASTYKPQHGRVTCQLAAIAFFQLCTLIAVRLSDSLKCEFGHITLYSLFAFCFLLSHMQLFSTIYCLFYSRLCLIFSLITLLSKLIGNVNYINREVSYIYLLKIIYIT